VDESTWMVGVDSSVLNRAVLILLALGLSTVVVFVCACRLQPRLRLLRWAIRRTFHRCAGCHARNSSVALWRWQGRSPCWLCAECAFGVKDFDEVPSSRRQLGAQIASGAERLGRAAAFWSVPTPGGGGRYRPQHLYHRTGPQSSAQTASGSEHLGRAAAYWPVPTPGGGRRYRPGHLRQRTRRGELASNSRTGPGQPIQDRVIC
jgi:hypothetical protein